MGKDIRLLTANEVECRVQTVKSNGCSLLLYKNARVDMSILDEAFGIYGWQRTHEIIDGNLYCTISIYDEDKKHWVYKQDVGTESNTEKEKGQASDSFKRACFNLGIGRELYTSPFIWITLNSNEVSESEYQGKKKYTTYAKFEVKEIGCNENNEINKLVIVDEKGIVRYSMGKNVVGTTEASTLHTNPLPKEDIADKKEAEELITTEQADILYTLMKSKGLTDEKITETLWAKYSVNTVNELTVQQRGQILVSLSKMGNK